MTTISLATLLDALTFRARIENSEGFTTPQLQELIIDAGQKHNPAYVLSPASNVPAREKLCVVYLAWAALCRIRASKFANETDVTGASGFGTDRSTPFEKNMRLAKSLLEDYKAECASLGLSESAGPAMSDLTRYDSALSATMPRSLALPPSSIMLSVPDAVQGDGTIVLEWDFPRFEQFQCVKLFYDDNANAIHQPWNFNSTTGVPQIRDGLTAVGTISDPNVRTIKLTGLVVAGAHNHRFLAVLVDSAGLCSYSTEVTIVTP